MNVTQFLFLSLSLSHFEIKTLDQILGVGLESVMML